MMKKAIKWIIAVRILIVFGLIFIAAYLQAMGNPGYSAFYKLAIAVAIGIMLYVCTRKIEKIISEKYRL